MMYTSSQLIVTFVHVASAAFQVRLSDGPDDTQGRVEVSNGNGTWGTICHDSWDINDANVVCRMLGFVLAKSAPGEAHFGEGSGAIFLDEVGCNGSETNLADCLHTGIGIHDCDHGEDVSAICSSPGKLSYPCDQENGVRII